MDMWDIQPSLRSLYSLCVEPVCQDWGVNRTELDILLFLANNPKYDTAAEISDVRCLAKSHVSTSLKTLEANGYIVRAAKEGDRRRVRLRLTEKAAPVVAEGRERQAEFAGILLEGFSPEERERLRSCFRRMNGNIKAFLEEHEG